MLTNIAITKLHPHPQNPRKDLGDITELAESIKARGVLQNLTVVPKDFVYEKHASVGKSEMQEYPVDVTYTVIIGHRRLAAAKLAGLTELPCVIVDMDQKTQIATMLLENIQRSDLTVYEQAQGFQMMLDLGSTVKEISDKSGFSVPTVRRRVKMMELDQNTLREVSDRQISFADFDRLAQIEDIKERNKCLEDIGTSSFDQGVATQLRRQGIKKNLPIVKQLLKEAKAKAIKQSETWSGKYDNIASNTNLAEWKEGQLLIPKKVSEKLFYYLDEQYGSLRFFTEHKRAAPVKKSAEELARQKKMEAAWDRTDELRAVTYKLRSDFIAGLSLNSKNATAMLKGALSSIIFRGVGYASADRELILNTLGVDDIQYSPKRAEEAAIAFEGTSAKGYPVLIYANFGDGKDLSHVSGYKGEWPKYNRDARLVALYVWLCSLGYEMSDEEKALQDGTHRLFTDDVGLEDKS